MAILLNIVLLKFKVNISGYVPYITKCGYHGHLAVTLSFKSSFRAVD